jgi:microcin C transport system permease protein
MIWSPKSPIAKRRIANFKANRRALWSAWIFGFIFVFCLCAEFVANDKPILIRHDGAFYSPVLKFYSEADFGGEFQTEAEYPAPEVQCLIKTGGLEVCLDDPEGTIEDAADGMIDGQAVNAGWVIWPLIPFNFKTIDYSVTEAPSAPDANHWLGTDDQTRDIMARIIYGVRISTVFALIVVSISSVLGIAAGAAMGYFGGMVDLFFQRIVEIWGSTPALYVIIILGAIFNMNFVLLTGLVILFGWTGLTGLVRAEFLRARNFEYVRAARALGVSDRIIMFRHLLPNAMVATLTFLPFSVVGAIGTLTSLDFLGFGLPPSYPSLGELALQAKNNMHAPWIAFASFFSISIMLSLLVFIFEGIRDAFDPRKTFK